MESSINPDNLWYSSLDGVLFNKDQTTLVAYPPAGKTGDYTIPNSVTSIGDVAFYMCYISEVYFDGDAPTMDGSYVFYNHAPGAIAYVYRTAQGFPPEGELWESLIVKYRSPSIKQEIDTFPFTNSHSHFFSDGQGTYTLTGDYFDYLLQALNPLQQGACDCELVLHIPFSVGSFYPRIDFIYTGAGRRSCLNSGGLLGDFNPTLVY